MRVTVMTRGRARANDYTFFPEPPADSWWRAYGSHTSFEHPTLLVESDGQAGTWRLYAGGIPSRRRDSQATRIRYSCVLDGGTGEAEGVGLARALVTAWLVEDERARLGRRLDQWAGEDIVDAWYLTDTTRPGPDEVAHAVAAAVDVTGPHEATPTAEATAPWPWPGDVVVGSLAADEAKESLLTLVTALLTGTAAGAAVLLNLLDFGRWPDPSPDLVALVSRSGPDVLILDPHSATPFALAAPTASASTPTPTVPEVMRGPKGPFPARRILLGAIPLIALATLTAALTLGFLFLHR